MGYGVIGSPTGSGPVSLGSSPSTPAIWLFGTRIRCRLESRPSPWPPLCSGLARRPLKAVAPVRIRSGVHGREEAPHREARGTGPLRSFRSDEGRRLRDVGHAFPALLSVPRGVIAAMMTRRPPTSMIQYRSVDGSSRPRPSPRSPASQSSMPRPGTHAA